MRVASFLFFLLAFSTSFAKEDTDLKKKPLAHWKKILSKDQVEVCRQGGTERPFTGKYNKFKKDGTFVCSSCSAPLFSSKNKYDSGTGWPSFWAPVNDKALEFHDDNSFFMHRTELKCHRCGAHLGHVFDDGPKPTGKRYCINSVCLKFVPNNGNLQNKNDSTKLKK